MPVTIDQVLARVGVGNDNTDQRAEQRRVVLETLAAVGLLVNSRTGEVYSPAPASSNIPEQRNARWYGSRGRGGR